MCKVDLAGVDALLTRWELGELDEAQVHAEAERLWCSCDEWPDFESWDPQSSAVEALALLDGMNHELVVKSDVPAFKRLLAARGHEVPVARAEWERYWDTIDWGERRRALLGHPFYLTAVGEP